MFHHVAHSVEPTVLFYTWAEGLRLWRRIILEVPEILAFVIMPNHIHLLHLVDVRRQLAHAIGSYVHERNARRRERAWRAHASASGPRHRTAEAAPGREVRVPEPVEGRPRQGPARVAVVLLPRSSRPRGVAGRPGGTGTGSTPSRGVLRPVRRRERDHLPHTDAPRGEAACGSSRDERSDAHATLGAHEKGASAHPVP